MGYSIDLLRDCVPVSVKDKKHGLADMLMLNNVTSSFHNTSTGIAWRMRAFGYAGPHKRVCQDVTADRDSADL